MRAFFPGIEDDFDRDRLLGLAAKCCHETVSEEEILELESVLKKSVGARHLFREYTSVHVTLGNCLGAATQSVAPGKVHVIEVSRKPVVLRRVALAAAAALVLGVGTLAVVTQINRSGSGEMAAAGSVADPSDLTERADELSPGSPATAPNVASAGRAKKNVAAVKPEPRRPAPVAGDLALLTSVSGVKWAEGAKRFHKNTWIGNVTVALEAGYVRLKFRQGASLTLRGPGELKVLGANAARLVRGKIVSEVPDRATGFRLETSSVNVIDLGTAFGVSADAEGDVEVHVFEGEVELVSPTDAPAAIGKPRKLRRGEAVRTHLAEAPGSRASKRASIEPIANPQSAFQKLVFFNSGIDRISGPVHFMEVEPTKSLKQVEHNKKVMVLAERRGLVLEEPMEVSFHEPGEYVNDPDLPDAWAPAGVPLRSYLLHFNPVGKQDRRRPAKGSVTFDGPVVGVVMQKHQLELSDRVFGEHPAIYRNVAGRTIELHDSQDPRRFEGSKRAGDGVVLTPNRRTLRFDWMASAGMDEVRVLVLDPEEGLVE